MKHFFSDNGIKKKKFTLIGNEKIITSDYEIAETLNRYFGNAVRKLHVSLGNIKDPIQAAISKYADHPSIVNINKIVKHSSLLFEDIQRNEIESELEGLIASKGNTFKNILAKLLKENKDICGEPLFNIMNNGIKYSVFDNGIKSEDVTPVHKGGDTTDKKCYTPISVLPVVSTVFERIIHKQISYKWIHSLTNSYMDTATVSMLNLHHLH